MLSSFVGLATDFEIQVLQVFQRKILFLPVLLFKCKEQKFANRRHQMDKIMAIVLNIKENVNNLTEFVRTFLYHTKLTDSNLIAFKFKYVI